MTALKTLRSRGFTLIELLVVIAIIGVLAAVVLVAINPVQRLARTRDAGRQNTIGTLGNAMEAYATTHEGAYVTESATWLQDLVDAGEVSVVPAEVDYSVAGVTECSTNAVNNSWCYDYDSATTGDAIVFVRLESDTHNSPCTGTAPEAHFVWSSANGGAGIVCTDGADPVAGGAQTFQ